MPGSTQASTACAEPVGAASSDDLSRSIVPISVTFDRMTRERIPNFFRLSHNPYVAQACHGLTRLVADAWPGQVDPDNWQVFLANSGEEALSGAIKLARYAANAEGFSGNGILLDEDERFEYFATNERDGGERLSFLPGVEVVRDRITLASRLAEAEMLPGFVVVPHDLLLSETFDESPLATVLKSRSDESPFPVLISYWSVGRVSEGSWIRKNSESPDQTEFLRIQLRKGDAAGPAPDIVVCDESFVDREVPFGAFVASKRLFQHWSRKGMATFHSTTYQPNSVSTLHLMNCLRAALPGFVARHESELKRIESDPEFCRQQFANLFSRSLAKLTSLVGFDQLPLRTDGNFVEIGSKRLFDGVAGVACSVRGHNPPNVIQELHECGEIDVCRAELAGRLADLTGLPNFVPAVSGGSAVEQALKLGLLSQSPRNYVLALRGGFGGKTLFALTGTWKASLKAGLSPLYPNVLYVDPFADNAAEALEAAFRDYPIGVVQLELVQGVGGVRAIPDAVLNRVVELRREHDCLLFVDEVQTGMFRTGPFVRSCELGIQPDLLCIGKATSDMMFPFGLTLFSDEVRRRLDERGCRLPELLNDRYGYETGIKTVLNTLRRAETDDLAEQVRQRGESFTRLLAEHLSGCPLVRDVRCFGLLIGIELDAQRRPNRWLKKLVYQLYLLAMIEHPTFPLLVGFCQYEPNVLKLTPPLSISDDEVRSVCETLASVLKLPLSRVAMAGFTRTMLKRRPNLKP